MNPALRSSVGVLCLALHATAADCPGDAGYVLDISPEMVPIGTGFDVTITAPPGALIILLASGSAGPTPTPYGSLCVGLPAGTFAFVQPAHNPLNLSLARRLRALLDKWIAAVLLRRSEELVLTRPEPIAVLELTRNRPREVLHDRPAGIRAELVAAGKVEFLNRPQQRHIAVTHQLEKVLIRRHVTLGDRYHQPQIGPRDLVLGRHGLLVKLLDLVHQAGLRLSRVKLLAQPGRLELQEVILPD